MCVCEFVMQSTVCITLNGVKRCPREHGLKTKSTQKDTQNCLMFKHTWLKWWMFYTLRWSLLQFQRIHSIWQYSLCSILFSLACLFCLLQEFAFSTLTFIGRRCCCVPSFYFQSFFSSSFRLFAIKIFLFSYDFSLPFRRAPSYLWYSLYPQCPFGR